MTCSWTEICAWPCLGSLAYRISNYPCKQSLLLKCLLQFWTLSVSACCVHRGIKTIVVGDGAPPPCFEGLDLKITRGVIENVTISKIFRKLGWLSDNPSFSIHWRSTETMDRPPAWNITCLLKQMIIKIELFYLQTLRNQNSGHMYKFGTRLLVNMLADMEARAGAPPETTLQIEITCCWDMHYVRSLTRYTSTLWAKQVWTKRVNTLSQTSLLAPSLPLGPTLNGSCHCWTIFNVLWGLGGIWR